MKAVRFPGANVNYGKPKNWDETKDGPCHTLPTHVDEHGNILSVWEPTPEERAMLLDGGNIVLTCHGIQPPVRLDVALIPEGQKSLADQ